MSIWDWSSSAGSNGSIDGVNIAENCAPGGINDAVRAVMANVRAAFAIGLQSFLSGASPLPIANGGTGGTTAAAARTALGVPSVADVAGAIPSGAVAHFAMNTAPTGWLSCNGAAVSRTTYAALFSAIGITFGDGDGSTTFNLPELRGEFLRGWDGSRGVDAARVFGSAQTDDLKSHSHSIANVAQGGASEPWNGGEGGDFNMNGSGSTGSTGGTETRPRNVALLACIKS
jgi:phage-related tail fiber protein